MRILLDWDGTFTAAPEAFYLFCKQAKKDGHKVDIVTMRKPSKPINLTKKMDQVINMVYYTSEKAKIPFMKEKKIEYDIFIEDHPKRLFEDYKPDK